MRTLLTLLTGVILVMFPHFLFSQPCEWAQTGRTGFSQYQAQGVDVAVDAAGNVYVVGVYDSLFTLLGQTVKNLYSGGKGVVVSKLTKDGFLAWIRQIDSPHFVAEGIAVRGSDVLVFGSFFNNLTIGSGFDAVNFSGQGTNGILLKYDTDGNYGWGRNFNSPSNSYLNDVVFVNATTLLFTGRFRQSMNIQGTAISITPPSATSQYGFYGRMSTDGSVQWVKISGDAGNYCDPRAIGIDPGGAFYLAGLYRQGLTFGGLTTPAPGSTIATLPFVARFNASGDPEWVKGSVVPAGSGSTASFLQDIKVLSNGQVMVTGGFSDRVTFLGLTSQSGHTAFALKIQTNGNLVSSHLAEGNQSGNRYSFVEQDVNGNIWLGGQIKGYFNIRNDGTLVSQGHASNQTDMLLAYYQYGQFYQGILQYGGNGDDQLTGGAIDMTGRLCLSGSYSGNLGFNGETFTSSGTNTSDLLVARLCAFGATTQTGETYVSGPEVQVWPNPNPGWIRLNLPDGGVGGVYDIMNGAGSRVMEGWIPAGASSLALSHLPQGWYALRLHTDRDVVVVPFLRQD